MNPNQVVLIILDGFGIGQNYAGNAISAASMPFWHKLLTVYPHSALQAAGEAVGLPKDEEGNSEVGHLNLGAGRIVYQDLPRINMAIADGSFFKNEAFLNAIHHVQNNNSSLHLIGLIGAGGIHSNIEHLFALLHLAKKNNLKNVFLHLFTDGRDSPPTAALTYVRQIENEIINNSIGKIVSLVGRYYAMDRDYRWERTLKTYELLTAGKGFVYNTAAEAIGNAYRRNETDEFISPTVIAEKKEDILQTRIKEHDAVIFYNFRVDRPRQLTKMFVLTEFNQETAMKSDYDPFTEKYYKKLLISEKEVGVLSGIPKRDVFVKDLFFTTMTKYDRNLNCDIAFPLEKILNPLGHVIAEKNLPQLHIAESEKEKMVAYFFDGLRDDPFYLEERVILPSAKVGTYDQRPEMSAADIVDAFFMKINLKNYPFSVINFANPDMLGHTGNMGKTIEALGKVDGCLSAIYNKIVLEQNGALIITSDHGNCEEMIDANGNIDTKHSALPVPFALCLRGGEKLKVSDGILADVAPTVLTLLGIPIPAEMTGRNLILSN